MDNSEEENKSVIALWTDVVNAVKKARVNTETKIKQLKVFYKILNVIKAQNKAAMMITVYYQFFGFRIDKIEVIPINRSEENISLIENVLNEPLFIQ